MKVIVAGGRDFTDIQRMHLCIWGCVMDGFIDNNAELICGMARGADMTAYSLWLQYENPVHKFYAAWNTHGKAAGFLRNADMARVADRLIAFWDGSSRGTAHMIQTMEKMGKPVRIFRY